MLVLGGSKTAKAGFFLMRELSESPFETVPRSSSICERCRKKMRSDKRLSGGFESALLWYQLGSLKAVARVSFSSFQIIHLQNRFTKSCRTEAG